VSCSPGLEDPVERAARRAADDRLADELESLPFEEFIERWRTQPLFAGETPAVGRLAREDQRRNRPAALADAMRGLGTGVMEPLWARLDELQMPVRVIAGERDAKFVALARRMAQLVSNGRLVVVSGGHGLPLENPRSLAQTLLIS